MKVSKIYFATTNEGKIAEAKTLLGIGIEGCGLPIDEIQSLDASEVARKKALAYYEKLQKPILVEDVSLTFQALNGLPGTYINDFSKVLDNKGLCHLMRDEKDRCATAITTLVFIDSEGTPHEFVGEVHGDITKEPRGEKGFGWDPIFQPNGSDKTLAEMDIEEKNTYSMRARAFEKFKTWLETQE